MSPPDRSLPPPLGVPPALQVPAVVRGRLANGLEWLHVERADLPLVDVQVVIRSGGATDPEDLAGLAALTAEAVEEGTVTRTGFEIADGIDRLGASLRIRAGWDATMLALHALSERLPDAFDLAADILRNATFPEAEVRRRRDERIASLIQERDEPAALAARAIVECIYGDHPYGRSPAGTSDSVGRLDRDVLVELHRARYRPGNAFVVSVGAVPAGALEALLQRTLGDWSGGATPAPPAGPARPAPPALDLVDRPGAPQSELRIGTVGPARRSPDHAILLVLNTLLGGAFTSRLNLKLREEKGFTYGARSSFAFRRDGGPFVAGAAVGTDSTAEAVEDALLEIRRLSEERVPEPELERARSFLELSLPRRLETGAAMAAQLADLHLHGLDEHDLVAVLEQVARVSPDDILAAARRWLDPDRLSVVVVGDAERIRSSLERLDLAVHDRTVVI